MANHAPGDPAGRFAWDFDRRDLRDGPGLWGGPSRANGDWERCRDANEPDFTIGHSDFDFNGWDREHRHGDPTKRRPVVLGLGLTLNVVNLQPVGADD